MSVMTRSPRGGRVNLRGNSARDRRGSSPTTTAIFAGGYRRGQSWTFPRTFKCLVPR